MGIEDSVLSFIASDTMRNLIWAVILACATAVASKVVKRALHALLDHPENPLPASSLIINIGRGVVWVIGGSIILQSCFGINPNALVTALGVGGVALSLGLQDTISNIVGGLGLMVSRAVRPGDRVTVGSTSGVVTDVTWRSTTLRTRGGDVDVIPNSVLNKTTLTHIADANAGVCKVPFAVAPDADLDAVTTEVRAAVAEALGSDLNPQYQTGVNFAELTAYGTQGEVVLHVADGVGFPSAKNRVAHALHGRPWLARAV